MIGPLGRLGAAATLGQHCPQMTQRRCSWYFPYFNRLTASSLSSSLLIFLFPLSALACPVVTKVTALDLVFLGRSSLLFIIHHIGLSTLLDCSYISSITEIILWSGEAYLHLPRPVHQLRPPVLAGPLFIPVLVPTCPARTCLLHHRLCPPSLGWTAGRSTAAPTSDS